MADDKIKTIVISFKVPVDFPPGFEQALEGLVNMVCEAYEKQNPTRVMWPFGRGQMPTREFFTQDWDAPLKDGEPRPKMFHADIFQIEVSEREAYDKDLEKRGYHLVPTNCSICGSRQFKDVSMENPSQSCANGHRGAPGVPIQQIHILKHGRCLCGFGSGTNGQPFFAVPNAWPTHHKWVAFNEPHGPLDTATCKPCRREYSLTHKRPL